MRMLLNDEKNVTMKTGICLSSYPCKRHIAIAWYDEEEQKIKSLWTTKKKWKQSPLNQMRCSILDNRIKKLIIFLLVIDLLLVPILLFPFPLILETLFCIPFILFFIGVIYFILAALLMTPEEKRYHGAMHMLFNSSRKGKVVKTARALKLYSRFYNNCSTNKIIYFILLCILPYCLCLYSFNLLDAVIMFSTLSALLWVLKKLGMFNFFQYFTTLPPSEKELNVVLVAAKLLRKKEEEYRKTIFPSPSAKSFYNGIYIKSADEEYIAVATIDPDGKILGQWLELKEWRTKTHESNLSKLICVFLFLIIFFLFYTATIRICLIVGFISLIFVVAIDILSWKNRDDCRRFHAAEHMVIAAWDKYHRLPTFEEVYKCSRFDSLCGTNKITHLLAILAFIFICTFIPSYPYIFFIVELTIYWILYKLGYMNFMQYFTTLPPTDREIEVAIKAMEIWIENEIDDTSH